MTITVNKEFATLAQLWGVPGIIEESVEPKVVLVTGATGQIGGACAKKLAQEGYSLVLTGRNEKALREVQYQCELEQDFAGGETIGVAADLHEPKDIWSKIWLRPLYGLVHCAAVVGKGAVHLQSTDAWLDEFRMNIEIPYQLCRKVAGILVEQGTGGRIVLLSSINAFYHNAGRTAYGASKAAVDALVRQLAVELGPHGITCNTVRPGNCTLPMHNSPATEEMLESIRRRTPLLKLATPKDVAYIVSFYLSEGAGHITGTHLICDGGFSIHAGEDLT